MKKKPFLCFAAIIDKFMLTNNSMVWGKYRRKHATKYESLIKTFTISIIEEAILNEHIFFSFFDLKCESNCAQPKFHALCFESCADFINELNTFWGLFSNSFELCSRVCHHCEFFSYNFQLNFFHVSFRCLFSSQNYACSYVIAYQRNERRCCVNCMKLEELR